MGAKKTQELEGLEKHRHKVWKSYYQKWQKKPIACPYLNKEVEATQLGWRHIAGFDKPRSIEDTHRRLNLFKYSQNIVEKSGTCQFIRGNKDGSIDYTFEAAWKIKEYEEKLSQLKRVKVTIKVLKDGRAVFYSVM